MKSIQTAICYLSILSRRTLDVVHAMMIKDGYCIMTILTIATLNSEHVFAETNDIKLTDQDIIEFAARPYNKYTTPNKQIILGKHRGNMVRVDYFCADLCPDYTIRVIHYKPREKKSCSAIGGVEKTLMIPVSIFKEPRTFCFPQYLIENWHRYIQ